MRRPVRSRIRAGQRREIEAKLLDCARLTGHAAVAEEFEHVFLAWLAEGQTVERQVLLHPAEAREVDAQRVWRDVPLDVRRPWVHPVRSELAVCRRLVGGNVVRRAPRVRVG